MRMRVFGRGLTGFALVAAVGVICASVPSMAPDVAAAQSGAGHYFPPAGNWAKKAPADLGMDPKLLADAVAFAESRESTREMDFSDQERIFGTLLGSVMTHPFQQRSARRTPEDSRAERLRQERLEVYGSYAGLLVDFRQALPHHWFCGARGTLRGGRGGLAGALLRAGLGRPERTVPAWPDRGGTRGAGRGGGGVRGGRRAEPASPPTSTPCSRSPTSSPSTAR